MATNKIVAPIGNPRFRGDLAYVRTRGYTGHVVIVSRRTITRGRNAGQVEYKLASLGPGGFGGKTYGWRLIGESELWPATASFPAAMVQDAMDLHDTARERVQDRKAERAAMGSEALAGVHVGDIVTIRYKGGDRRNHKVVDVLHRTGKVAIESPHHKTGRRWILATHIVHTVKPAVWPTGAAPLDGAEADATRTMFDGIAEVE